MARRIMGAALQRKRRQDRLGLAMLSAVALGFGGLFYGAARIDAANGISVSESLDNNGIHGAAAIARHFESPVEEPAREARLIGRCGGRLMAAMEESAFPAGCAWIEPIREFEAGQAGADHSESL